MRNDNNLCLIYAIVVGISYFESDPLRFEYCKPYNKKLEVKVNKVVKDLALNPYLECGVKEVRTLEQYFKHYQIMIIDAEGKINPKPIYLNHSCEFHKFIYISLYKGHYYTIKSVLTFYGCNYYCHYCKKRLPLSW